MNPDLIPSGEHCASTSNRNFEGRQGKGARTHLVSPAMAAAAAIYGKFVDVRELDEVKQEFQYKGNDILDMFENYTYLRFDKTNVLRQGVLTPCEIKKLKLPNRSIMKIKLINFSKILFFIIIMYNDKFL